MARVQNGYLTNKGAEGIGGEEAYAGFLVCGERLTG